MADPISQFVDTIMNGKTAGIPNIAIIILIVFIGVIIYFILTRKPKVKEYIPLDMKKETKRRFKHLYKYFGMPLGKTVYSVDADKPVAFGIGYMKVVEMENMKRLEPIHAKFDRKKLDAKHEENAQQVYGISYSELNTTQKRNIDEIAKEELRNEEIETFSSRKKRKIRRGKVEVDFSVPIPMYVLKICGNSVTSKILARVFNYGVDWALFEKDQISFEKDKVVLTASFQKRTPFDIFVFSKAGKNLVEDITYQQERENIWQETANQIPRAVHFDTEASKSLLYRREDAKLEAEKRKSQKEAKDF